LRLLRWLVRLRLLRGSLLLRLLLRMGRFDEWTSPDQRTPEHERTEEKTERKIALDGLHGYYLQGDWIVRAQESEQSDVHSENR